KTWHNTIERAKELLLQAQIVQARNANKRRRHVELQVGDKVLLWAENYTTDADRQRPSRKLSSRYYGPFVIEKVISPSAYKLALPPTLKIHPVLHVSQLKRYHDNPPEFQNRTQEPPPPIEIRGNTEYEVAEILARRKRHGQL